jgi:hypothetical protein
MVGVMHTPDIILKVISSLFGRYQSEAYSINFNGECSKLTLGGLDGWKEWEVLARLNVPIVSAGFMKRAC